jgi:hypothetical protein
MTVQASGGGGYASGHGGGGQGSSFAATPLCGAVLLIAGEAFPCDWPVDQNGKHAGWGHTNKRAQAVWNG